MNKNVYVVNQSNFSSIDARERRFILTFALAYLLWVVLYARFESSVKWAYGVEYWTFLVLSHFTAISIVIYTAAKHFERDTGLIKKRFIKLSLIVGGIVVIGFMLEDFLAISFAGLFSFSEGVLGSVAGVPFIDPHYGYYVAPVFPTGYFEINGFKLPWAYVYLSLTGVMLICLSSKIKIFENKVYMRISYYKTFYRVKVSLKLAYKLEYEKYQLPKELSSNPRRVELSS
ncbi:MAG: hypothetical protein OdinLCB4_001905 [Candidatus Odinarchaeum yellowstonii]|uniref:Uncharacterized protein n=1 Tax=Odinarchaeota yellowstonii (strain LCB_4) TaxID=1841599 RepID=A0AAF0IBS5_ODILC|nr:MAG: hypothetical protein OdinLCB4_001905 [Candidatus Odinarchaeum yellowstonii]